MVHFLKKGKGFTLSSPRKFEKKLADDLKWCDSPNSANITKRVVIVMDGLKEFTLESLVWTLKNIATAGCVVTLVGAMPWLNLPLSSKTWQDVWSVRFKLQEKNEMKFDAKYQKLQTVVDLCNKYEVVVQKEVVMGHPLRLLIAERIMSLEATWVVFDRHHHKRNIEYYTEKLPCNMVIMNEDGSVDLIRSRSMINDDDDATPGESPYMLISRI
ncbi:hypothetical protein ACFE04_031380 [Oxalis oulophora]